MVAYGDAMAQIVEGHGEVYERWLANITRGAATRARGGGTPVPTEPD